MSFSSRHNSDTFIHGCRVNLVACFIDAADVLWSVLQNNNKSSCPLDRLQAAILMLLKHFHFNTALRMRDVLSAHLAASSSSLSLLDAYT